MTEDDWLGAVDPGPMLRHLLGRASERKLRLFAVACCRRVRQHIVAEASWAAVKAAERFADGRIDADEMEQARQAAEAVIHIGGDDLLDEMSDLPAHALRAAVAAASQPAATAALLAAELAADHRRHEGDRQVDADQAAGLVYWAGGPLRPDFRYCGGPYYGVRERAAQADLLRDLFGNPFRVAPTPPCPCWLVTAGRAVRLLAERVYANWAFERLPIIAGALEEAGHLDIDLLAHCRVGGQHARGCWAVDLILGRA
jgi:hypothetical protein